MDIRTGRALSVAALLVVAAAACTDPTVAPKSSVTGANIWADPNSYQAYIAKLYGGLILTSQTGPNENCDKCGDIKGIDEGFSEYLRLYWYLEEVPTDEAVIGWGDAGLPELNRHNWDATNQMVNAMYYRIYFQVALANEFLRQTTDAVLTSRGVTATLRTQIQNYRAEARFLRALAYAHGVDLFGSIPLITENDAVGGALPHQASRDSLYNYAVSELVAIRDSLPAKSSATYARATPAAADMLLAELYLNAGVYTGTPNWAGASAAAARAIAGGYTLNPVFRANFTSDNNLSPEIIFVAAQDGLRTQTWGGMTFLVHAGCGGSMQASWFGMDYCWGGYRLKQQVFRLFDVANDARAAFFYSHAQDASRTDSVSDIGNFNTGVAAPKFTNLKSNGDTAQARGMIDTDFPIFRLGEAYLIYAEAALNGAGNTGTALGYLNFLRERAYGNATHDFASWSVVNGDTILAERARELMFEGKRRTDLIRFNRFTGGTYLWAWKGNQPGGTSIDAKFALYPIPANELSANPTLTQNPGY